MNKKLSILLLFFSLCFFITGCKDKDPGVFSYSEIFDGDGYFDNIKASKIIKPFDFASLVIPVEVHSISDEDVENELEYIKSYFNISSFVYNRSVQMNDRVNIDYVGSIDGVEFEGGSTGGAGTEVTIGVTSYIDDFLEQLIGSNPGDIVTVEVAFPEDYGVESLNGKDAIFITTINYILEPSDLTDEDVLAYLYDTSGWTTVEEALVGIRDSLQKSAIGQYIQERISEYVAESLDYKKVPTKVTQYYERSMLAYFEEEAKTYEMTLEEFLPNVVGIANVGELIEYYAESNQNNAGFSLAIQAIAEQNQIKLTEEELPASLEKLTGSADYDMYIEYYGLPYLKQSIIYQQVINYMLDRVTLGS